MENSYSDELKSKIKSLKRFKILQFAILFYQFAIGYVILFSYKENLIFGIDKTMFVFSVIIRTTLFGVYRFKLKQYNLMELMKKENEKINYSYNI